MSDTILTFGSKLSVYELFQSMNLTPGEDSDKIALSWLEKHGKLFTGYVNGCWLQKDKEVKSETGLQKVCDIFSGKHLCDIYVSLDNKLLLYAAENSSAGFKTWSVMTPASRSKILYNIAQTIEKYQQLFATIEAVSSGKHISRVIDKDIPNLIESFNYYACCTAQLEKEWIPTGPVCVVPEEYNNPSLMLSLRVSSILASGSSVLLLPDSKSSLSSFLLAEICSESGLPNGVLNVIPINQENISSLGVPPIFSHLVFTGSLEKSIVFSKCSAEVHVPCSVLIPRRPVAIVYEMADLHSAADGVLEAFFSHDTRSKSGGCKVLVQESVMDKFLKYLSSSFSKILIGHNLSKTDMSCIVTEEQKRVLTECLEGDELFKRKVTVESNIDDKTCKYNHMMPTLVTNVPPNFQLAHEELGGPILVVVPFRTVKESVSMFNCDNKGSPVSIWTEQISVAMEVALKLKTGIVWVNSDNITDAKVPYTGVYLSGNSVEGGKEAMLHHLSRTTSDKSISEIQQEYENWLATSNKFEESECGTSIIAINENIKEYKLFIGGIMAPSANGTIKYDDNIFIPSAVESDIKNAVSSAASAQPGWESLSDFKKRKIFFAVIDKLKKARKDYVAELHKVTKNPVDECEKEFDVALDYLFNLATQDKFCEPVQDVQTTMLVVQNRYPLGVIGLQCPDEQSFLSLIILVFSTIFHGNAVVAISSTKYPTIALKMCEVFLNAKVPNGVINIICGNNKRLVPALCKNEDVNAIWFTDVPRKIIYTNTNPCQRVFCCNKIWTDFNKAKNLKCAIECTYTKNIFLPAGDIFAN